MNVQVIEKNGQNEWAVVPYDEYQKMLDALEMLEDIRAYDEGMVAIQAGEEVIPSDMLDAEMEESWLGCMKNTGEIVGDIVSPVDEPAIWNALAE